MQDGRKAVWSILYISVAFFPCLKQKFIAYHSYKMSLHPDCIFEIHKLWQSGFSRAYSHCCCSCSFEADIIKIGQSSHKMYSNNIVNFQESTTILNACIKKSLETYWIHHILWKRYNHNNKKYNSKEEKKTTMQHVKLFTIHLYSFFLSLFHSFSFSFLSLFLKSISFSLFFLLFFLYFA